MSSNSSSTGNNSSAVVTNSMFTKLKSTSMNTTLIILFSLTAVGLFIGSFVGMSNFVGSKDDWNVIQPQITKILLLTLFGTFALIVASFLYFIQDSARTIYFILVLTCLSMGLSFSALAISAISR